MSPILDEIEVTSLVRDLKSSVKQTLDSQMATMINEIKTTLLKTVHKAIAHEMQLLKKQILEAKDNRLSGATM